MREEDAFDGATFLGLARGSKRDPYRLSLFAWHFESDERATCLLPIRGGTLVVTDQRLLEFRPHLDDHGPWNVKAFSGYAVAAQVALRDIRDLVHEVAPLKKTGSAPRLMEDTIVVQSISGAIRIVVSRAPDPTLTDSDFATLRASVLSHHA